MLNDHIFETHKLYNFNVPCFMSLNKIQCISTITNYAPLRTSIFFLFFVASSTSKWYGLLKSLSRVSRIFYMQKMPILCHILPIDTSDLSVLTVWGQSSWSFCFSDYTRALLLHSMSSFLPATCPAHCYFKVNIF